jgi:hypothetical protein
VDLREYAPRLDRVVLVLRLVGKLQVAPRCGEGIIRASETCECCSLLARCIDENVALLAGLGHAGRLVGGVERAGIVAHVEEDLGAIETGCRIRARAADRTGERYSLVEQRARTFEAAHHAEVLGHLDEGHGNQARPCRSSCEIER